MGGTSRVSGDQRWQRWRLTLKSDRTVVADAMNWRLIWWALWSNMITLLATVQTIIAALMLEQDVFSHETFRKIVIANAILTAIVAQVKKNKPPGPRPTRDDQ